MEKPIFIGIRYASRAIGCWTGAVESRLGKPDALLRFGTRDQKAWIRKRIDSILPQTQKPIILYGRVEARRFVGISIRAAQRILPDELGVAFFPGFGGELHPLFLESQLSEIRRSIAAGGIKIQTRSKKAPVFGAGQFPARHVSADLRTEQERIINVRRESEFWARMI